MISNFSYWKKVSFSFLCTYNREYSLALHRHGKEALMPKYRVSIFVKSILCAFILVKGERYMTGLTTSSQMHCFAMERIAKMTSELQTKRSFLVDNGFTSGIISKLKPNASNCLCLWNVCLFQIFHRTKGICLKKKERVT